MLGKNIEFQHLPSYGILLPPQPAQPLASYGNQSQAMATYSRHSQPGPAIPTHPSQRGQSQAMATYSRPRTDSLDGVRWWKMSLEASKLESSSFIKRTIRKMIAFQ